ncbi:MAG TPA: ATP-grasp domain-containing protein [bacterium]|nr:ATP-grasp domain-containing protein [bacterium]
MRIADPKPDTGTQFFADHPQSAAGAVVIGGHFHALGLIRQLARRGVSVILVDHEPCMARFSRYLQGFYRSPRCDDAERFSSFLIELAERKRLSSWVLFPTHDESVYYLANHRDRLKDDFRISTPAWEITRNVYNKRLTYRHARKIGIPIPDTFFPADETELMALGLSYPVILKPAVMRHFFSKTGRKAFLAQNPDQLRGLYREACLIIPSDEIMIQDLVPDCSENLYGYCPYIRNGEVYGRIVAKRPRQHPRDFGQATTYARTLALPEIEKMGNLFLKSIGFEGVCEVEFIRDRRDGRFKLLEVNPRIWGWHTLAEAAGVPLGYLAYRDGIGRPVRVEGYETDVSWMRLLTDIPTVFKEIARKELSVTDYLKSLRGHRAFAVLAKDDPVPFFSELMMAPYLWRKRGF